MRKTLSNSLWSSNSLSSSRFFSLLHYSLSLSLSRRKKKCIRVQSANAAAAAAAAGGSGFPNGGPNSSSSGMNGGLPGPNGYPGSSSGKDFNSASSMHSDGEDDDDDEEQESNASGGGPGGSHNGGGSGQTNGLDSLESTSEHSVTSPAGFSSLPSLGSPSGSIASPSTPASYHHPPPPPPSSSTIPSSFDADWFSRAAAASNAAAAAAAGAFRPPTSMAAYAFSAQAAAHAAQAAQQAAFSAARQFHHQPLGGLRGNDPRDSKHPLSVTQLTGGGAAGPPGFSGGSPSAAVTDKRTLLGMWGRESRAANVFYTAAKCRQLWRWNRKKGENPLISTGEKGNTYYMYTYLHIKLFLSLWMTLCRLEGEMNK